MALRIESESDSKSPIETYKEQALAAFARAEQSTSEDARAEFLQLAVEWLKLATEAANLQENRGAAVKGESASNPE